MDGKRRDNEGNKLGASVFYCFSRRNNPGGPGLLNAEVSKSQIWCDFDRALSLIIIIIIIIGIQPLGRSG